MRELLAQRGRAPSMDLLAGVMWGPKLGVPFWGFRV